MSHESSITRRTVPTLVLASLVAFLALMLTASAGATGTLDQAQPLNGGARSLVDPALGFTGNVALAQTFTAGITGRLDQVDLMPLRVILDGSTGSGSLIVEIRTVAHGVPSDTVLGRGTVAETQIPSLNSPPQWVSVPLSAPAAVIAGVRYAIVISADRSDYEVFNAGDVYPRGENFVMLSSGSFGWIPEGVDLTFRTYVTPAHHGHLR